MARERTKRTIDGKVYRYTVSDAAAEKERQAKKAWYAENYDRLTVDIPKGMMQQLTELAEAQGISRRKLILDLLEKELEKKNSVSKSDTLFFFSCAVSQFFVRPPPDFV